MKKLLSSAERSILDAIAPAPDADLATAIRRLIDSQPGTIVPATGGERAEWLWRKAELLDRVAAERTDLIEATVMAAATRDRVLQMIDQAGS